MFCTAGSCGRSFRLLRGCGACRARWFIIPPRTARKRAAGQPFPLSARVANRRPRVVWKAGAAERGQHAWAACEMSISRAVMALAPKRASKAVQRGDGATATSASAMAVGLWHQQQYQCLRLRHPACRSRSCCQQSAPVPPHRACSWAMNSSPDRPIRGRRSRLADPRCNYLPRFSIFGAGEQAVAVDRTATGPAVWPWRGNIGDS